MTHLFRHAALAFLSKQPLAHSAPFIAVGIAAICTPGAYAQAPAAPASVTATSGDSKVAIGWVAPSGTVTSYKVYRGPTSGSETYLATQTAPAIKYTDSTAVNGNTYYYYVTALNGTLESPPSSEVIGNPIPIPAAPTAVTAVGHTGQVALSWTAPVAPVTSYRIYRSTTSGSEALLATPSGTGTTYTDTSVTNGTRYYYKVLALNGSGASPLSAETSATPVAIPTGVSATAGPSKVAVNWTAPTIPVDSYKIYRSTTSGAETYFAAQAAPSIKYTDTTAVNGTTYYYRISAVLNGSESDLSGEVNGTPVAPPAAPTNLAAAAGYNSAALSWTLPSGTLASIKVYRGTTSGGETLLASTGGTATTYTDNTAVNGTTYYYQVSAVILVGGEGPKSNEAVVTPGHFSVLDYNPGANPFGKWTYGWYTGGTTTFNTFLVYNHSTDLDSWTNSTGSSNYVHNNTTSLVINHLPASNIYIPADMVVIHPDAVATDKSVVRWTAPGNGTVTITGQFSSQDDHGATTDVAVLLNGVAITSLSNINATGLGDVKAFSLSQTVSTNDKIDFVVGNAGNVGFDSTGLQATITY